MSMINNNIRATPGAAQSYQTNGGPNLGNAMAAAAKQSGQPTGTAPAVQKFNTEKLDDDKKAGDATAVVSVGRDLTKEEIAFERQKIQVGDNFENAQRLVDSVRDKVSSSTHPRRYEALARAETALEKAKIAQDQLNTVKASLTDVKKPTAAEIAKIQELHNAAIVAYTAADEFATAARVNENFINRLFNKMVNAKFQDDDGKLVGFEEHLNSTIAELGKGDSSAPQKLARYQKAIMQFTVHTNATSSMVKSITDLDKGVIRDFN